MIRRTVAGAVLLLLALTGCAATPEQRTDPLPLPRSGEPVYVLGDSWSAGFSAADGRGYVDLLAAETGWDVTVNAQSGTGYTANLAGTGEVFGDRVDELPEQVPAMVVVQGGLNDEWGAWQNVGEAADTVLSDLSDRYPGTPIVVVGPSTAKWPVSEALRSIDEQLRSTAESEGVWYVSPITDEWVTAENIDTFIDVETKHPSTEGHLVFAERLLDALSNL